MLADWPPGARWPSMGDPAEMMALATKLHEEKEIRRRHLQRWPCIALRSNLQSLFHHDDSIGAYRHRFVFHSRSDLIAVWNSALIFGVIYSTAYSPLAVVFPEARWKMQLPSSTLAVASKFVASEWMQPRYEQSPSITACELKLAAWLSMQPRRGIEHVPSSACLLP